MIILKPLHGLISPNTSELHSDVTGNIKLNDSNVFTPIAHSHIGY